MAFCQDIAYKELKPSGASIPLKDCISQDIAYKELKRFPASSYDVSDIYAKTLPIRN